MFPVSDSSQTIIDCLLREVNRYGVEILMNSEVRKIETGNGGFTLHFAGGKELAADYLCIASGGYPKPAMFDWLKELGHTIEDPVPSLFTFNLPQHPITKLMGLSVENAKVKITGSKLEQEGPVLITHWGLSGPAVLKLSAWGARQLAMDNWEFSIVVNWLPEYNEQLLREKFQETRFNNAAQKVMGKNLFGLPNRLWEFFAEQSGVTHEMRWADLPATIQNKLVKQLTNSAFTVKGKTTFKEEFVTAGGIKLNEVDSNTMMSKKINNLFFAGEIIDVDGITGGYNFQHAWTSGFMAAKHIATSAT
jgi:predicted Rossmann fold flavoprotein